SNRRSLDMCLDSTPPSGLSSRQLSTHSGSIHLCIDPPLNRPTTTEGSEVTTSITDTAPLLIGGELRPATGGATFDVLNPATEEVIGRAADAGREDMDAAIAA